MNCIPCLEPHTKSVFCRGGSGQSIGRGDGDGGREALCALVGESEVTVGWGLDAGCDWEACEVEDGCSDWE